MIKENGIFAYKFQETLHKSLNNTREKQKWVKSIPPIDQFINWCMACNSCFSFLWDVDIDTIADDNPTKRT
jgi:hypothetical protein